MASPVSIGDAYLMARLALKLGRAFTKGRRSAPAEFREVENQLYSLSAALSALDGTIQLHGSTITIDPNSLPPLSRQQPVEAEEVIKSLLRSCEETLEHLKELVEKYGSIGKPTDPESPMLKRWSKEIKDNWKKVKWTTEGGDIATLRSQLMVHTNSLNLLLGVINNCQGNRLEDQISQVTTMLREIHTWFVENLKDKPTGPRHEQGSSLDLNQVARQADLQFELYKERPSGIELVCSRASLHSAWNEKGFGTGTTDIACSKTLFQCHCADQSVTHAADVGAFRLSHLSFTLRLTGEQRAWMVYKAANKTTNKMVSLVIKNIPPSRMGEFENNFIENLALRTARSMIRRNMGTMLAYIVATEAARSSEARVLHLMGDMSDIQKQIESVTFTTNRQSYSRSAIKDIQILHYGALNTEDLFRYSSVTPNDMIPQNTAEVLIFFGQKDEKTSKDDIDRIRVYMKYSTRIRYLATESKVVLQSAECSGLNPDEQGNPAQAMDVSFQLTNPEAASQLRGRLEDMRVELFAMSLKSPNSDEKIVLKLQAKGVHTEEIDIADSDILIVQNTKTECLRLVVVGKNGCTILSQTLAKDFLNGPNGKPNFGSSTYVMQIERMGIRKVHKYENGFRYLHFSNVQTDRLFELGLAAVSSCQ